jgi:hypothetical protein
MEHKELLKICDYCDEALTDPWFTVNSFRWEGWNVSRTFQLRMCKNCYPKIHHPLRKAAFDLMRQSFQEAIAKLRQDMQKPAGKI